MPRKRIKRKRAKVPQKNYLLDDLIEAVYSPEILSSKIEMLDDEQDFQKMAIALIKQKSNWIKKLIETKKKTGKWIPILDGNHHLKEGDQIVWLKYPMIEKFPENHYFDNNFYENKFNYFQKTFNYDLVGDEDELAAEDYENDTVIYCQNDDFILEDDRWKNANPEIYPSYNLLLFQVVASTKDVSKI